MKRRAVTVWLTEREFARFDARAEELGVETGALLRCAAASGIVVAHEAVSSGLVKLRARSSRVPVPAAAASVSRSEDGAVDRGVSLKSSLPELPSRPAGAGSSRAELFRRVTQRP